MNKSIDVGRNRVIDNGQIRTAKVHSPRGEHICEQDAFIGAHDGKRLVPCRKTLCHRYVGNRRRRRQRRRRTSTTTSSSNDLTSRRIQTDVVTRSHSSLLILFDSRSRNSRSRI